MKRVKPLDDLTFTPGITVHIKKTVKIQTCANEGNIFVSLTTRTSTHNQTEKQADMWPEENRYDVFPKRVFMFEFCDGLSQTLVRYLL